MVDIMMFAIPSQHYFYDTLYLKDVRSLQSIPIHLIAKLHHGQFFSHINLPTSRRGGKKINNKRILKCRLTQKRGVKNGQLPKNHLPMPRLKRIQNFYDLNTNKMAVMSQFAEDNV